MWENFLVLERRKLLSYRFRNANTYFWRTYTGAELDYLEERDAALFGYEFKFNNKTPKAHKTWIATYSGAVYACVNKETYLQFINKLLVEAIPEVRWQHCALPHKYLTPCHSFVRFLFVGFGWFSSR